MIPFSGKAVIAQDECIIGLNPIKTEGILRKF
jgi:hypothetical protein